MNEHTPWGMRVRLRTMRAERVAVLAVAGSLAITALILLFSYI
ncbi:hypothetical protein [Sphingomonas crocodyli]|nr:hypothetical protein [Sphingomonas crocodyli]